MTHLAHKRLNIIILLASIITAIAIPRILPIDAYIRQLGPYSYLGAFVAGILFVCSFTVSIGAVMLTVLAKDLNPILLAIIAGAGAVIGNFFIFRFIKDDILDDVAPLFRKLEGNHLTKLLHTKYFRWSLPVIGALLIISPLPDELGISLMDIAGMSVLRFLTLSFFLNSTGIFLVALAAHSWRI